jgi:hypothetical protein
MPLLTRQLGAGFQSSLSNGLFACDSAADPFGAWRGTEAGGTAGGFGVAGAFSVFGKAGPFGDQLAGLAKS